MIVVWVDITAPLYWWKEFDTYKVGTVSNSCSTMHKLASRDLTLSDFSWDHLIYDEPVPGFTEEKIDGHWRRCMERLRPREYYYHGDAKTEVYGQEKGEEK